MLFTFFSVSLFGIIFSINGQVVRGPRKNLFVEIFHTKFFNDPTQLIAAFFQHGRIFITAPPRFSKTTNMDMLRAFCEMAVDRNGNRLPKENQENYKIFSENLDISKDPTFETHFAKYPVVYMDFNRFNYSSYDRFLISFKNMVSEEFSRRGYLSRSDKLNVTQKEELSDFVKKLSDVTTTDEEQLRTSVRYLSYLLHAHFNTTCIVFIEDFDAIIQRAMHTNTSDVRGIIKFIEDFATSTFESSQFIERALINSCLRVSGLLPSDVEVIPFLQDSTLSLFYGFKPRKYANVQGKHFWFGFDQMEATSWYGGYRKPMSYLEVSNYFGVYCYKLLKKPRHYCNMSAYIPNLHRLVTHPLIQDTIERLLDDYINLKQGIQIQHYDTVTGPDMIRLIQILKGEADVSVDEGLLIQYMTELGYFSIVFREANYAFIKIPNKGMAAEVEGIITNPEFYRFKYGDNLKKLGPHLAALGGSDSFQKLIDCVQDLYRPETTMPSNTVTMRRDFAQACKMSGLYQKIQEYVRVTFNKLDLFLITNTRMAIIVEFRVGCVSSYDALSEIVDKSYHTLLNRFYPPIRSYILLGLRLSRKRECFVSYLVNSTDISRAVNIPETVPEYKHKHT